MALKARKQIYDNVHGYIEFTDAELKVVDNPLFQRLRHIMQVGTVSFVYPGATHTRFEHCIGTMFMMDQFLMHVKKDGELLTSDDEVRQKLRLAALLHDVGHYPFSHTIEHVIMKRMHGKSHVDMGVEIVDRFFGEALSSYKTSEITDMISGKDRSEFGMLLSSAFDADKSDYLLRDAYHTGVVYGRIGLQRLIRTASFERGKIIFDKDEAAVESFLLGRYYMYRSVYHHKTVMAFQVMVERIYYMLINEGYLAPMEEALKSDDEAQIFAYNDHMLFASMDAYLRDGKDGFLKDLIRMFLLRRPLSAGYINVVPEEGSDKSAENQKISGMIYNDAKMEEFAEKAGVEDYRWIFPVYMRPLSLIDEDTQIYIKDSRATTKLVNSKALILNMIGKRTLYDARIYTHPRYKSRLQSFMGELS